MFRTVPLSIIRSFPLYTQQRCMSYRFADSLRAGSGRNCKSVWHTPLLCLQWKTPDDGQRNCPKHEEFYSKNKFEKLVNLVGFIIRIYHDEQSPERQIHQKYWHDGARGQRVWTFPVSVKFFCPSRGDSLRAVPFEICFRKWRAFWTTDMASAKQH